MKINIQKITKYLSTKTRLKIVLITFLLLILMGGSFLYGLGVGLKQTNELDYATEQYNLSKLSDDVSNSESTDTNSTTESWGESTKDWLLYSDPNGKFTFKYPNTWIVVENDNTLVCPNDYMDNEKQAKECFTLKSDKRSFAKFASDLENEVGFRIDFPSSTWYTNGNSISHLFREGSYNFNGFNYSYITNYTDNIVVKSTTAWNDYGYHIEPQILKTLKFNN